MDARQFLDLSTKLFADLKRWVEEAGAHHALSPSDLALLRQAMGIVERVTLRETDDTRVRQAEGNRGPGSEPGFGQGG